MDLSNMKTFNSYLKAFTIETIDQMVEKFNTASGGAIVLTTQGVDGDFLQESFWQSLHSARRRVDRYAANAPATPTEMTQGELNSVKVAGAFGPVAFEPGWLTWMQQDPELAVEMASRNMAEVIVQDQLNTGLLAAVAAITNQGAGLNVAMAGTDATHGDLNNAHALFGDHSGAIVADVMDGTSYHSIIGQNLANSENLYQSDGVLVVDILGKIVVVTDAPALRVAGTGIDTSVLGLAAGGIVISDGGDLVTNIETTNGQTRIETTLQADYSFVTGLKGYAWDIANGGKSPDDAAIGLGTNWDLAATSNKHTAGVRTYYTNP